MRFHKHFHVFKHSFYFLRTFDWFVMVYCYITVTGMKYLGNNTYKKRQTSYKVDTDYWYKSVL